MWILISICTGGTVVHCKNYFFAFHEVAWCGDIIQARWVSLQFYDVNFLGGFRTTAYNKKYY